MRLLNNLVTKVAKEASKLSQQFNLGNGSTWPGHIALKINPSIIKHLLKDSPTQVIFVVGTNGKTTTSHILSTILKESGKSVIQNKSGANLLNGIASSLLLHTNPRGKLTADYAVFEVDENNLSPVIAHVTPKVVISLNLFRDQLDRYGELDSIARKWNKAMKNLTQDSTLILNADDPLIAYLAKDVKAKVMYYGLSEKEKGLKSLEHASDSVYCPQCGSKLVYKKIFYSHLGIWECPSCHVKRPLPQITQSYSPLPGTYNLYNTLAATLCAQALGISPKVIDSALHKVTPAFGRQEIIEKEGKTVQLFLSKNPTSMNESLRTIKELGAKNVLFVLNDRIPDGRDVSWIWDIDLETIGKSFKHITASGDRTYDMALRMQYADLGEFEAYDDLKDALSHALEKVNTHETLFILPTYSAMLEVRKILTGRKIL